jgi:hypothetical protein
MMNRRRFLIVFTGLAITGVALLFVLRKRLYNLKKLIAHLRLQLDEDSPLGILSEEEMKTIVALSEVLIPTFGKSGTNDEFIRNYVNFKTNNVKGYLKEYRNGVKLLDETSKKVIGGDRKFYELNLSKRDKVLSSILWRYRSGEIIKCRLERVLLPKRKIEFRYFVVRDILKVSFQQTSAGWAIVGYSHYPGVPAADPRDYTKPLPLTY